MSSHTPPPSTAADASLVGAVEATTQTSSAVTSATPSHRSARDTLLWVWRTLATSPLRAIAAVMYGTIGAGSAIGLIGASAWLIARAAQRPGMEAVGLVVVVVRALGVTRGVFRYLERLTSHEVALDALARLRTQLYEGLARSPLHATLGLQRGQVLARIGADVDSVGDVLIKGILPFAVAITTSGLAIIAVGFISIPAALGLTAGVVLTVVIAPWIVARATLTAVRAQVAAREDISWAVTHTLDHRAEWEVAGKLQQPRAMLDAAHADIEASVASLGRWKAIASVLHTLGMAVGVLVPLFVAQHAVGLATYTAGEVNPVWYCVAVLVPLATFEVSAQLPAAAVALVQGVDAAGRVRAITQTPHGSESVVRESPTTEPPTDAARTGQHTTAKGGLGQTRLTTQGLVAGWVEDKALVVPDLDWRGGDIVVIEGPSGAGKTALLLTLAGLLPPLRGSVQVGGLDPASLPDDQWRGTFGLAMEDSRIFGTTVRENVRLVAGDVSDGEVLAVLDLVGASAWLAEQKNGLDQVLQPGGADMSGGERRRLILARALIADSAIGVFDEPTEHLDSRGSDDFGRIVIHRIVSAGKLSIVSTHDDAFVRSIHTLRDDDNTIGLRRYSARNGQLTYLAQTHDNEEYNGR